MRNNLPNTECKVNHIRSGFVNTIHLMDDPKKILWDNVRLLMVQKYGEENLWKAAHEAKVGPATMGRIKEMRTSTGIDTLEKLAALFKVEPWQLLVPGIDTQEMLVLQHMKEMCPEQKSTFTKISYSLTEPKVSYDVKK